LVDFYESERKKEGKTKMSLKFKKMRKGFTWPAKQQRMLGILEKVKKYKDEIMRGLDMHQMSLLRTFQVEDRSCKLFDQWLAPFIIKAEGTPLSFDDLHLRTGKDLISSEEFINFRARTENSVWEHRIETNEDPAVVSFAIMAALQAELENVPRVGLAYFSLSSSSSMIQILATIIEQLLQTLDTIPHKALAKYRIKSRVPTEDVLIEIIGILGHDIYLVLDSLDIERNGQLLKRLTSMRDLPFVMRAIAITAKQDPQRSKSQSRMTPDSSPDHSLGTDDWPKVTCMTLLFFFRP